MGGEDTGISLEDIRQGFGKWVADIVAGCSEPDKTLSWEARKEHTIKFLTTASHDIKYVSCADKLHNLSTIAEDLVLHGPAMWDRFNRGRDQQAWYYRGVRDALGNGSFESVPIYLDFSTLVGKVFG